MVLNNLHTKKKRKGQGLVEFALVAPVLLLIIFGIVDFGWMIFNFAQLTNSLREGLRYGSVLGFTDGKQYQHCNEIRRQITDHAGLSGIRGTDAMISIWYDDGRPSPTQPIIPNAAEPDTFPNEVVGTCPVSGTYDPNEGWVEQGGNNSGARALRNDDRLVIEVNVRVNFLTPFIRAIAPNGITMNFRGARTIFPAGEPVN